MIEMRKSKAGVWRVTQRVKHGRIRLMLQESHALGTDGPFELEGQAWSSANDESDVDSAFFAPIDEDDGCAAQLRCIGHWESTQYGFTLFFEHIEELGPAPQGLPLQEQELRLTAGRDLSRGLHGTMDFESRTVSITIGEFSERILIFER